MKKSIKVTLVSAVAAAMVAGGVASVAVAGDINNVPTKRDNRPDTSEEWTEEEIAAGYAKTYSTWKAEEEAKEIGARYEQAQADHQWVLDHQDELPKKRGSRPGVEEEETSEPSGTQADAPTKRGNRPDTSEEWSEEEIAAGYAKTYSTWKAEEEAKEIGAKYEEAKANHQWVLDHQDEFPKKRENRD